MSFQNLPIDAYPDLAPPRVEIVTQWPGHAAEEVERLITVPIEIEMNGIPNLEVMRSMSLYGLSSVTMTFDDGTDLYFARQQVFERIPSASVPDGVTPGNVAALLARRARLPLRAPEPRSVGEGAQDAPGLGARPAFRAVPGVADVSWLGGETMQYQVLARPDDARAASSVPQIAQRSAQQRERGRRLLLGGRTVLLRPRARARQDARRHRQHRARGARRHAGAREGRRRRWRSAMRRGSASSASRDRTTRSRASS